MYCPQILCIYPPYTCDQSNDVIAQLSVYDLSKYLSHEICIPADRHCWAHSHAILLFGDMKELLTRIGRVSRIFNKICSKIMKNLERMISMKFWKNYPYGYGNPAYSGKIYLPWGNPTKWLLRVLVRESLILRFLIFDIQSEKSQTFIWGCHAKCTILVNFTFKLDRFRG